MHFSSLYIFLSQISHVLYCIFLKRLSSSVGLEISHHQLKYQKKSTYLSKVSFARMMKSHSKQPIGKLVFICVTTRKITQNIFFPE